MEHRKTGGSELELPVVTLGAWAIGGLFWGGSDDDEAIRAIQASIEAGADAVDTAPIYGCGHSETVVGKAIQGRRDKVKVLTKCGIRWDTTEGEFHFTIKSPEGRDVTAHRTLTAHSVATECENSLKRLGIETIDLYQVHAPSENATAEETMGALMRLKQEGKIRAIGVSNYNSEQMTAAMQHAPLVSNQIRYNLLDRRIEEDPYPFCRRHGLGVIAYSPMAMGLLTGKITPDRTFPESDVRSNRPLFSVGNRRKVLDALEQVRGIADHHRISFAQLAVAWVIAQPGITTALVGARNATQAEENAAAGRVRLSADELKRIEAAFAGIDVER